MEEEQEHICDKCKQLPALYLIEADENVEPDADGEPTKYWLCEGCLEKYATWAAE